jgi:hypothetical protein
VNYIKHFIYLYFTIKIFQKEMPHSIKGGCLKVSSKQMCYPVLTVWSQDTIKLLLFLISLTSFHYFNLTSNLLKLLKPGLVNYITSLLFRKWFFISLSNFENFKGHSWWLLIYALLTHITELTENTYLNSKHNHMFIKWEQKDSSKMVSIMQYSWFLHNRHKTYYSPLTTCKLSIDWFTQKIPLRGEVNYKARKKKKSLLG